MPKPSALFLLGSAVAVLSLSGCGAAGSTNAAGSGGTDGPLICMPVDGSTVFDKSFTQTAWSGLQKAEAELGVRIKYVTGQQTVDIEPNLRQLIRQKCDLIVNVGFAFGDATQKLAQEFPDQKFAIVDYSYEDPDLLPNVRALTFRTDESAFLAGIAAAGVTETGKVGVFGGMKVQPVTTFMDGLEAGIEYYNEQTGSDVELLGWDASTQTGLFTGDFLNVDNGRRTTETLLQQGADIVMPVAGQVGLGALAAVKEQDDAGVIWVDTDGCVSAADFCPQILTSSMKNMDVAIYDLVEELTEGSFEHGLHVADLANNGVALADFHEWDDRVPQEVRDLVERGRQGVVDGSIDVTALANR